MKAAVYGISAQGAETHKEFAEKNHFNYPLLVDADGKISKAYGMLTMLTPEQQAQMLVRGFDVQFMSKRGTFIIDPQGVIRYFVGQKDMNLQTHGADMAKVLANLQAGKPPTR